MQESQVSPAPRTSTTPSPTLSWVPVVDGRGRTRMEARWCVEGAAPAAVMVHSTAA